MASNTDPEAISAAILLARLVRRQTQWETVELLQPEDVTKTRRPKNLVIMLSDGALESTGLPKTLMAAVAAWGDSVNMMTVKVEGFAFPTTETLKDSIVQQVATVLNVELAEIAITYEKILSILSAPFTPSGRFQVLESEVSILISRMKKAQRRTQITGSSAHDPVSVAPNFTRKSTTSSSRWQSIRTPSTVTSADHALDCDVSRTASGSQDLGVIREVRPGFLTRFLAKRSVDKCDQSRVPAFAESSVV
jgi:hypothetical protein